MDLSRWYNLRKQAEAGVRPVARAVQIERSTIPVTMEDEDGEFEAVVPVPDAIGSGVRAGAVAQEALEHADGAAADALQAALDAAAAQTKAQEALDAALLAVVSSVIQYAVGVSDTTAPSTGWSVDNPVPAEGEFVWMRTVVTYADESTATSTPVLMSRGGESVKIESLTTFYTVTADTPPIVMPETPTSVDPSPWWAQPPPYSSGVILVSTERIIYSDESFAYTEPKVVHEWVSAGKALAEAEGARFLAEGLFQVIPSESAPTTSPTGALKQGDQWWKIGTGADANRFVGVAVWDGAQWQDRQIVADSVLVPGSVGPVLIEDGAVTATKIAGDAIDGKTITGATMRTAPSGQRIQLDIDGLKAFNPGGDPIAVISSGGSGGFLLEGTAGLETREHGGSGANRHADLAPGAVNTQQIGGDSTDLGAESAKGRIYSSGRHSQIDLTGGRWGQPGRSLISVRADGGPGYTGLHIERRGASDVVVNSLRVEVDDTKSLIAPRAGSELHINGNVQHTGRMYGANTFSTKANLEAWSDAPDGTRAWVFFENREYVRVNGAWVPFFEDTGWVSPNFISTFTASSMVMRRKNGIVTYTGEIRKNSGNITSNEIVVPIGSIPEDFRPPVQNNLAVGLGAGNSTSKMNVRGDGALQIATAPTGNTSYLGFTMTFAGS